LVQFDLAGGLTRQVEFLAGHADRRSGRTDMPIEAFESRRH
jgi:hypothetical protein